MFWDKGYAPSANIEALLEKESSTVEEFLDEEDILQECKTLKKNLVNYLTRPEVIRRLVELITTEPSEDVPMAQRFRYANMSCEILTLGLPSLDEKLLSDAETLQLLYSYLEKKPPLNPLLSSFFSKTFSMLFTKKPEQDWFLYQQMCLQLLEYIKSQKNFLDFICNHFDTPVIPDLIMQMMKDIDGGQLKRNLYEWLTEDKIVERLIAILRNPQETDKHANVADFFCDLITQGRLMRQTEQENDSFEPAFDGSNPILRNIESVQTIEALLNVILEPNALESSILSGISVVLTLIKPITFTDEPNSDRQRLLQKREREFHLEVQETVITVIAPRLQEFVHVLKNPPAKPSLETTAAVLSPPFGKTRLQVCRVFTALLETKHETIHQAICATDYFDLLLDYFKEYCWNNFLHSEMEKALHMVFYNELSNNTTSTDCTDIYQDDYLFNCIMKGAETFASISAEVESKNALNDAKRAEGGNDEQTPNVDLESASTQQEASVTEEQNDNENATEVDADAAQENHVKPEPTDDSDEASAADADAQPQPNLTTDAQPAQNDLDKTKTPINNPPTEMQTYLIVNCQLVSKLVNYWRHNLEAQSADKGRRLGYMGHLIKILRHITNCISESEHIAALIESNFVDDSELKFWQSLIDAEEGEFTKAVSQQSKLLANCNPHEDNEYNAGSKDFLGENTWDIGTPSDSNVCYSDLDNTLQDIVFTMDNDQYLFQFGQNIDDDDDDDDEHGGSSGDGHGHDANTVNPSTGNWGTDFNSDNFADFDAHFSTFGSDLGMPQTQPPTIIDASQSTEETELSSRINSAEEQRTHNEDDVSMTATKTDDQQAEYDNNANVEKAISDKFIELSDADNSATTASAATSIVSRLQSVLLDGEDDYEDDEGMWTKPLGGSNSLSTMSTDQHPAQISNGPSKANEFNHVNDNSSSKITTGSEQDQDQEQQPQPQQQKSDSINVAAAKTNAENATTTT
ncbi:serine/threonine-protein phosphatase 6 regulatory subunit 3 isoform X2 [Drosophila innubila]|uniref:serine/threonine-protein phosphatase 6 regulatory subunit 3 isoform X2 n=1 Tax=Drosophila innubila TaxID=198719 RepID=UPI00148DFBA2|nr:serine/threonine-protein phosphatase 6 regulatory subunit 3 isoform X2 [Drosophila innubila]